MRTRPVDRSEILEREEIAVVVAHLRRIGGERRQPTAQNAAQRLALFRLSACCGLRASELAALDVSDVHSGVNRPYVLVRARLKGGSTRRVPLTWDVDTCADLAAWRAQREAMGAGPRDPLLCKLREHERPRITARTGGGGGGGLTRVGDRLNRFDVLRMFRSACRILGSARVASLVCHTGRHTFASWALTEHSLTAVKEALGHYEIGTTNRYAHVVHDREPSGRLFGSAPAPAPAVPAVSAAALSELGRRVAKSRARRTPPGRSAALAPASGPPMNRP